MPRTALVAAGGMVFHLLNRGVARMQLFEKPADYQAFEGVLRECHDATTMRICAYSLMPNHWHLLLWSERDSDLATFMQRLTITRVRRRQQHRGYVVVGHVYQGRYKSFPVETDEHLWVVARYVERHALRSDLVLRVEEWRWSSLWRRNHGTEDERSLLAAWPIDTPADWLERVNRSDDKEELEALRRCVRRVVPMGVRNGKRKLPSASASSVPANRTPTNGKARSGRFNLERVGR
jgi:putative transposase